MWKRKTINKLGLGLLLLCLLLTVLPVSAEETTESASSITFNDAIPDTNVYLYQVQTRNADGSYTTTEVFSSYAVDYSPETNEDMRELALTLEGYVDTADAMETKTVAADGTVSFEDLAEGLYLFIGDNGLVDGVTTTQGPVMLYLPLTNDDGTVSYDVNASIKPDTPYDSISVTKVWDDNKSASRPSSVQVQLKADGVNVGDPVTLSSANNWTYTWRELESGPKYTVSEVSVPSGYTVRVISNSGGSFTIRNTKSTTPGTTPTPTPNKPKGSLPYTGQLWWPVILMAALGLMFFLTGWIIRRNSVK